MRLLLINPRFPESFWSYRWAVQNILPAKRAVNPPLGLATLAALSPPSWTVEIIDENVESIPLAPAADIIGICGMGVQFKRQKELLNYYRASGYYVVAGGSYASLCPELYADIADTVVAGEAEYIWKQFCHDYEAGLQRALYHETGVVSLEDSPTPRFDLLKLDRYAMASMQFSRGCPFRCEFCDIIVMFGRKPRTKTVLQITRELDELRKCHVHNVFFVDDNLIGNKTLAKDLLRGLRDYQREHHYEFSFGTEASLNLSQDPELLQLLREANFNWVFIGIESTDPAALKETMKTQNLREDILTSVRRIYASGIDIMAGFIVGFDHDTLDAFETQYRFITESGIQSAMIGLLTALPRTPLYQRLEKEGRLIIEADGTDNTRMRSNIIPTHMSMDEMVNAYKTLYARLLTDRNIADRIRNKMRYFPSAAYCGGYSFSQQLLITWKLVMKGVLPAPISRLYNMFRTLPWKSPRQLPMVISDWIFALAMRDYAERCLTDAPARQSVAIPRRIRAIQRAMSAYLKDGRIALSLRTTLESAPNLSISLRGWLDRGFFVRTSRHLEKLLKHTRSTVTLTIEHLHEREMEDLNRFLNRLARYGDRVCIQVHRRLRDLIPIDSSVFHFIPNIVPDP